MYFSLICVWYEYDVKSQSFTQFLDPHEESPPAEHIQFNTDVYILEVAEIDCFRIFKVWSQENKILMCTTNTGYKVQKTEEREFINVKET